MQLFYDASLQEGLHELAAEEAKHAIQVLRHQVGDVLDMVDGRGGWYRATIVAANKRHCQVEAVLLRREEQRAEQQITLAVAPTKSGERYEWFLEKATEIGVDAIQPILTKHSERRSIRSDRMEKVVEAAMKQSLQAWLPKLLPLSSLEDFVAKATQSVKLIAYIDEAVKSPIRHNYQAGQNVCILIGPEGGFAAAEAQLSIQNGFRPVCLGPNRLRTETAAVVAAQTLADLNWKS